MDIPRLWVEDRYTVHFKYDACHWLMHIRNSDDPTVTLHIVEYDAKQTVKSVTLDGFLPVDATRYLRPRRYTDPAQKEREAKSAFDCVDWGHFIMTLVLDGLASVSDELVAKQHWEDLLPSKTVPGITRKRHTEIDCILRETERKFKEGRLDLRDGLPLKEFLKMQKEK